MQDILKIIFFVAIGVIALAIIIVGSVLLYKKVYMPKKFKNAYYKTVLGIVTDQDYRLINKFIFRVEENKHACIDHIIFGEKYIYLILSRYYEGDLTGKETDKDFILIHKKRNKKFYTQNLCTRMKYLKNRISLLSGLDSQMIISITLINDECKCDVNISDDSLFVCNRKGLKKLIKTIEARKIGKLNDDQLQSTVLTLSKLNRRK